ncbi:MAG: hypothetical protein ABI743_09560 [bacterium]
MSVMEYILVRGTLEGADPYPMQGIELDAVAAHYKLVRAPRLQIHHEDYGWEITTPQGIILAEVVYHPRLIPERLMVRAPEGGDLKSTFDLALELGQQLGCNVYNRTTGQEVLHTFPGQSAAEKADVAKQEKADAARAKGCGVSMLAVLTMSAALLFPGCPGGGGDPDPVTNPPPKPAPTVDFTLHMNTVDTELPTRYLVLDYVVHPEPNVAYPDPTVPAVLTVEYTLDTDTNWQPATELRPGGSGAQRGIPQTFSIGLDTRLTFRWDA